MAEREASRRLALRATPKLGAYVVLAALGAFAGLVFGRPELVAATAPLAVYVVAGLGAARRPMIVDVQQPGGGEHVREGESVDVSLRVTATADLEHAAFVLVPGPGLRAATRGRADRLRVITRLPEGDPRDLRFTLDAERWGAPRAGVLSVRGHDRFGLLAGDRADVQLGRIGVLPSAQTLRELIDPQALRATVGSRVAPRRGEGIELAEVRAFQPGDALRRINWRVSARRAELHVSDRHPELGTDVVILLDTFSDVGRDDQSTLATAVRAAAGLAAGYLARHDRVGIIGFGGVLTGIAPGLGARQLQRIAATLVASEVIESYAVKSVSTVPRGLLPPRALIVALTPLVDLRSALALLDLRARGFDLVVVELSFDSLLPAPQDAEDELARRLWRLRREALRQRLRALGATVVRAEGPESIAPGLAAAAQARRRARSASAR